MESQHSVTPLMIVIIAAFVTPIILYRLRLKAIPVVVAEITGYKGKMRITVDTEAYFSKSLK